MKRYGKLGAVIVGLSLFSLLLASCSSSDYAKLGSPAPDFTVPTLDGGSFTLSQQRGKPVFLNFWASWCGPCKIEMPHIQEAYQDGSTQGVVMLLVNMAEARSDAEGYIEENGFTFPVGFDSDGSARQKYGVFGLPTSFFIDAQGILRFVKAGPFVSKEELVAKLMGIR